MKLVVPATPAKALSLFNVGTLTMLLINENVQEPSLCGKQSSALVSTSDLICGYTVGQDAVGFHVGQRGKKANEGGDASVNHSEELVGRTEGRRESALSENVDNLKFRFVA